ncbi:hypothetical protein N2601_08720 [Rhizobium sp. CB3060]|uniref:hypothetical protein n=1 Tax=Rhizobium sp. CB3060 TaxID=3138255 RepID=UPI0021A53A22|nr:hypothetical protein [Rhizobium tropici]UWU23012.1 hypothetical protein N2601_08720 [Rhizobium tropici]
MDIWLRMPVKEWLPTCWYGGYLEQLPDLLVGKFPAAMGLSGIDRWKVWIVETPAERVALLNALSKPVPMRGNMLDFASGPDAAASKIDRSKHYGAPVAALYEPPEPDWPWITLFKLPSVATAGPLSRELGRGVYSYEVDPNEAAAHERLAQMGAIMAITGNYPEMIIRTGGARHEETCEARRPT